MVELSLQLRNFQAEVPWHLHYVRGFVERFTEVKALIQLLLKYSNLLSHRRQILQVNPVNLRLRFLPLEAAFSWRFGNQLLTQDLQLPRACDLLSLPLPLNLA